MRKSFRVATRVGQLALMLMAAGCDGDSPPPHGKLLDGAPQSPTAEAERLREMQLLRTVGPDGKIKRIDIPFEFVEDPSNNYSNTFAGLLYYNCLNASQSYTAPDQELVQRWKCTADMLLGMATDPGSIALTVTESQAGDLELSPGPYTILPQNSATNSRLARAAIQAYWTTLRLIKQEVIEEWVRLESPGLKEGLLTGEEYASVFVDSYYSAKDAYAVAIQNTLAVAHAESGSTPSFELAQRRSISNPELSKMAAAHLLVGGKDGFLGDTTRAFCTTGRLSGPQRTAMAILREAGIDPKDLLRDNLSTRNLVEGPEAGDPANPGSLPANGSVKARLGDTWGRTLASNQDVLTLYSLTEADFDAAREQLKSEISIWNRSMTATLPDRPAINGHAPIYKHFGATATPPIGRDPSYWAGLAQTDPSAADPDESSLNFYSFGLRDDRDLGIIPNYAALIDATLDTAELLLKSDHVASASASTASARIKSGFVSPLSMLLNKSDRVGRMSICRDEDFVYGSLVGLAADEKPQIALNDDDMACAVAGTVEGGACSLTGKLLPMTRTDQDLTTLKAVEGAQSFQAPINTLGAYFGKRVYIVKPKLAGNTTAGPGDWEVVLSTPLYWQGSGCYDVPVVPEATRKVGEIIAPNPDWCGESLFSCAGGRFDERLPLEDELTDDKDGVESSWRHYLNLAKSAALESDRLGEEYINSSLAADQREEELSLRALQQQEKAAAELENLQDICGTSVDPAPLLEILGSTSGNFDLSAIDGGACGGALGNTLPSGHPSSDGWECSSAGRAILNWKKLGKKKPALKPLADCIRSFADTANTTLGDAAVCGWKDAQNKDCNPNSAEAQDYPCVDSQHAVVHDGNPPTTTTECLAPAGATSVVLVTAEDALGLFSTQDTLAPQPKHSLCDKVRLLRNAPADGDELKAIVNSNRFDQVTLATQRRRIEFRATLGGYADVYIDGKRTFSTGRSDTGPSTEWPCTEEGKANFCTGDNDRSLMCWTADCSTADGRAAAATRLFKAVAAAQLTSYAGGSDPVLPVWRPLYLRHGAVPRDGIPGTLNWSTSQPGMPATSAPFNLSSNDTWQLITGDITNLGPTYRLGSTEWMLKDGDKMFAFGHTNPVSPPAIRAKYWGGLSRGDEGNGPTDPKFFYTALANGKAANPGKGLRVGYGADIVVDVGCSASCWAGHNLPDWSPGYCDCWGTSDSHTALTDDDLAKSLLKTSDPRGKPTTYTEVAPIEYDFEVGSTLDGLELLCEAAEGFSDKGDGCGGPPPVFSNVSALTSGGTYLKCLGDKLTNKAALTVYKDFPRAALEPLQAAGKNAAKGQMGTALTTLRQALLRAAESGPTIGRTVRDFGLDMKRLRETYTLYDLEDEIADVQFASTAMEQATACIAKVGDEASLFKTVDHFGANAMAAVATCVNSVAQIGFAHKLNELKDKETQVQRQLAQTDFDERFSAHIETLQKTVLEFASAQEEVQKQLGVIHDLQAKAERSVNKALWYLSQQATNQQEVTSVLAGKSKTAELRYRAAFNNSKRLAFLAARAIEQRLGVHLTEMRQPLPLVAAPSSWASTICTTSGINYSKLRGTTPPSNNNGDNSDNGKNSPYVFADAYIGDYITKLENVVESYRLTEDFHEGSDTAVVSLRDDVFNLRRDCDVDSPNQLYWASALNRVVASGGDPQRVGWLANGCATGNDGTLLPNCISVTEHQNAPFVDLRPQLRTVPGFSVQFGATVCDPATCGYRTGASIQQTITLEPGRYRFSWYTPDAAGSASALAGFARKADGTSIGMTAGTRIDATQTAWAREYFAFDVSDAGDYVVGFQRPAGSTALKINVGAPMLDRLDDIAGQTNSEKPKFFSDTTDVRKSTMAICQDTDGRVFRDKEWTRGCTYLCPDGYSSDCSDRARQACYWETSVNISQRQIESGHQFKVSGFARGNFNYRINSLGLNFVGTSLRSCTDSETPSACYGGGFIPYTIHHNGPYFVRNHQGIDFEAKLFTGAIEHARGLATERYLSNPMSDSDSSLITKYLRQELQGRPLDGEFVIRVWDEEGVEFNRIEDVQLILNYSYWTRFD